MSEQVTIAKTLRQIAGWVPLSRDEYIAIADQVERVDPADEWSMACCPMCQEVDCDDGCPLEAVRAER